MVQEKNYIDAINEVKSLDKKSTMAELIAKIHKDKIIEIYIGDTYEDVKYDDSTQKCAAVLVGKVVAAYAECLVLNCAYMDQSTGTIKLGNMVCLNERAIRTVTEVDESGILKDTFLSTRDSKIIKNLFVKK